MYTALALMTALSTPGQAWTTAADDLRALACAPDIALNAPLQRRPDRAERPPLDTLPLDELPAVLLPLNARLQPEGRWVDERGHVYSWKETELLLSWRRADLWEDWAGLKEEAEQAQRELRRYERPQKLLPLTLLFMPIILIPVYVGVAAQADPSAAAAMETHRDNLDGAAQRAFLAMVCGYNQGPSSRP